MTGWTAADMRDHFNERAAILEYDAGLPRCRWNMVTL
jgi:hypothetical protein